MIKKLFIAIIVLMCAITLAVILASGAIGVVEQDSYAIPSAAGIGSMKPGEDYEPLLLVTVNYDDELYSTITGYFVGADRQKIDASFPLFLKGGNGLRFLDEEVWLITTEVELYRSFEGLYLSEGYTYNSDMTQADDAEFILASLSNGLYINAQQAVFEGQLGDIVIPANSILFLNEKYFAWMDREGATMKYNYEESVFNANFRIGEHRYSYLALLDALGLVQQAIEQGQDGRPLEELLGEAEEILREDEEKEAEIREQEEVLVGAGERDPLADDMLPEEHGEEDETGDDADEDGDKDQTEDGAEEDETGDEEADEGDEDETLEQTPGDNPGETEDEDKGESDTELKPEQDPEGDNVHEGEERPGDDLEGDNNSGNVEGVTPPQGGEDGELGEETGGTPGEEVGKDDEGDQPPIDDESADKDNDKDEGDKEEDGDEGDDDNEVSDDTKPGEGQKPDLDGELPDLNIPVDPEDSDTEETPGENEGDGDTVPTPYREPSVVLQNLQTWSYALNMDMYVNDPSGAMMRGVSFVVYKKLSPDPLVSGGPTGKTEDGRFNTYDADKFEGKSSMLRRSRTGSQSFALSPLQPGETVYIQYNYRYTAEDTVMVENPDTGELEEQVIISRKRYYSDFIEVTLPTIEEGDVWPVLSDWNVAFAGQSGAMELNNLTMVNSSDYDEEKAAESHDFENFKLNTLPYVNRLEFTLTPVVDGKPQGDSKKISVNSGILSRAQKTEGGVTFVSSSPELESNTQYIYTVSALDRWGNEIPMTANGESPHTGMIYTRKSAPTAVITEVENIMNELTLTVEISDPDGALAAGEKVYLTALNTRKGELAALDGEWDTGKIDPGGDDVRELGFIIPTTGADGAKFELTLTSLAFSTLYQLQITGDYHPQPDGSNLPGELSPVRGTSLGWLNVYTASLEDGLVSFETSITELKDTSATLNFTMTDETTWDMLPMVDEFRIILTDEDGKEVCREILSQDELGVPGAFAYDEKTATMELKSGDHIAPQMLLYGDITQILGSAWDSFCISVRPNEEGEEDYTKPMQLRMRMPEMSLVNFTDYHFTVQAVVIKSGEEYFIPVSMTNQDFTTKKILPKLYYSDLFVASDKAELLNARIIDPDDTILDTSNNGDVMVQLYYGNTLLKVLPLTPLVEDDGVGITLSFDGIISGGSYEIRFVAAAYNDAAGYGSYQANYRLWADEPMRFIGGSDLYGSLGLQTLDNNLGNLISTGYYLSNAYIHNNDHGFYIANTATGYYDSYIIPCEPNTEYVIQGPYMSNLCRVGSMKLDAPLEDLLNRKLTGSHKSITISGYANIGTTANYHFTTSADAEYLVVSMRGPGSGFAESLKEYNEAYAFVRLATAEADNAATPYTATIDVQVTDKKGYLGREGENSSVTLTVERSKSMSVPSYEEYETFVLPLEEGEEVALYLDKVHTLAQLSPEDAWRVTLAAEYQGSTVQLDQITFNTGKDTMIVHNHYELLSAMFCNPYGNILVVSDFEALYYSNLSHRQSPNFFGTLDFQGHVVTQSYTALNSGYSFLRYIGEGATVKNLVYDYPNAAYTQLGVPIFGSVYGRVENVVVRTYGALTVVPAYNRAILAQNVADSGVLRNFIVKLGGDLEVVESESGYGLNLICAGEGTIENGYVYATSGTGFVARMNGTGNNSSNLFNLSGFGGHIFVIIDSWYQSGTNDRLFAGRPLGQGAGDFYAVGDYYSIGSQAKKNWLSPLLDSRMMRTDLYNNSYDNVWSVSSRDYTVGSYVNKANIAALYDSQWQKSILGDAFDVDNCVSMGFYPRLELPVSMQKYQEYIPLPTLGKANAPQIVSDSWGTGSVYGEHDLDSGYISLKLRNDNLYPIDAVEIEGLLCGSIAWQGVNDDGLYEIILAVGVDPQHPQYTSTYNITALHYSVGSVRRQINPEYTTTGFEFWKEISTPREWTEINLNMKWNYKLTADIDFATSDVAVVEYTINGRRDNQSSGGSFQGKIDGQNHVVKNVSIRNSNWPYLIYYAYAAEITNLYFEDVYLQGRENSTTEYCGLFGRIERSRVENVHIRNSTIEGGGYMGGLVGNTNYTNFTGCSVTDTNLKDLDGGRELRLGGMMGYNYNGPVTGCYTRNVNITVSDTLVTLCVGGLAGMVDSATLLDCYTHGKIDARSDFVGGMVGGRTSTTYPFIRQCFSYVEILQRSGDYAAGLLGAADYHQLWNCIALGNVTGTGRNIDRVCCSVYTSAQSNSAKAFAGQIVTGMADDDLGLNAKAFITGEELGQAEVWQDEIRLGANWDYSGPAKGFAPKLGAIYEAKREGWEQKDIPLPGQTGDPTLRIVTANYAYLNGDQFYVEARLDHPTVKAEDMAALYARAVEEGNGSLFSINLEGMELSSAEQESGNASIVFQGVGNQEASTIIIRCRSYTRAYDNYPLVVRYTDPNSGAQRELTAMVEFDDGGEPYRPYWRVSNLTEWNTVMSEHGKTMENILVTGSIDFAGQDTSLRELNVNRLEGQGDTAGFKNLNYDGGASGTPWMEKVVTNLAGLRFESIRFDFSTCTVLRAMSGPFIGMNNISDLVIKDISMVINRYSRRTMAMFANVSGTVDTIDMDTVSLSDISLATSSDGGKYVGSLIGKSMGSTLNVTARNISVEVRGTNIGGLGGTLSAAELRNITLEGFSVRAPNGGRVGGVSANYDQAYAGDITVLGYPDGRMSSVSSVYDVGGVFGWEASYNYYRENVLVDGIKVTADGAYNNNGYYNGTAGAVAGYAGGVRYRDLVVQNCEVEGNRWVGGAFGSTTSTRAIYNAEILNCKVINDSDVGGYTTGATGGLCGYITTNKGSTISGVVVQNCEIKGLVNVGGVVGWTERISEAIYSRLFVASDVTVTATINAAGGLLGSANFTTLQDSACGATVHAGNLGAGGLIGRALPYDEQLRMNIRRCYYNGTVSAGYDYAAGIIGYWDSPTIKFTEDSLQNNLLVADVRCMGSNVSLWINDSVPTGNAGTGTVYMYHHSLLNGQTIESLHEASKGMEIVNQYLPRLQNESIDLLVDSATLADSTFYTDTLNYDTTKFWYVKHMDESGNRDMPYTLTDIITAAPYRETDADRYVKTTILANGIKLPTEAGLAGELVVYASGINSINIETALPEGQTSGTVVVNGQSYTTDENGVISMYYDFQTPIELGGEGIEWTRRLERRVMTYGTQESAYWCYLDSAGLLHYGYGDGATAPQMYEAGTIDAADLEGSGHFVHLWQGQALSSNGRIYSLSFTLGENNSKGTLSATDIGISVSGDYDSMIQMLNGGQPFSRPYWQDGGVQVYYYFSLYKGLRIEHRVFNQGAFNVAPDQGVVYDGVVAYVLRLGEERRTFFGTLSESGVLQSHMADMYLGTMPATGIDHISNNLGFNGTVLLACYDDGSVIGVDYNIGEIVCPVNTTEGASFISYALSALDGLFSFGSETVLEAEGSYLGSAQITGDSFTTPSGKTDGEADGTAADGEKTGVDGFGAEGGALGHSGSEDPSDADASWTMTGGNGEGGNDGAGGSRSKPDGSESESETGGGGSSSASGGNGQSGGSMATGGAPQSGGSPSGTSAPVGGSGQSGGAAAGAGIGGEGEGEGEGADGRADTDGEAAVDGLGEAEAILQELFGPRAILYSAESGKYELVDSASLAPKDGSDSLRIEEDELTETAEVLSEDAESDFHIAWGISRRLDSAEKRGFALLGIAAAAAAVILVALYVTVVRKKKGKSNKGKH